MSDKTVIINEVFASIQGESTYAGKRCLFFRLAECNLRCTYCDTLYAQSKSSGTPKTIKNLVELAIKHAIPLIEITGGEPLLQTNTSALCEALILAGFTVLIETNGSLPIADLPDAVIKILDYKLPSSGETSQMNIANFAKLTSKDEIKFVIGDLNDYNHAKDVIKKYDLIEKTDKILFSTVFTEMEPRKLVELIMTDQLPVRMQLQMHKYIWAPEERGV